MDNKTQSVCVCVCYLCGCHNRNISFLSTCRCAEEKHVPPELLGRSCFLSLRNSATGCFFPSDPSSFPEITFSPRSALTSSSAPVVLVSVRRLTAFWTFAACRQDPARNDSVPLFQTKGQLRREQRRGAGKRRFNACEWCSPSVGGGNPCREEPAESTHPNMPRCVSPSV